LGETGKFRTGYAKGMENGNAESLNLSKKKGGKKPGGVLHKRDLKNRKTGKEKRGTRRGGVVRKKKFQKIDPVRIPVV